MSETLSAEWSFDITAEDIDGIGSSHTITIGTCENCIDGWKFGEDEYDYPDPPSLEFTNIHFLHLEWLGQEDINGNTCTSWKFSTDYRSIHPPNELISWGIEGSTGNGLPLDIPVQLNWNSDILNDLSEEYEIFIYVGQSKFNMREINNIVIDQNELYVNQGNDPNIKILLGACASTGTNTYFLDSDGDGWGGNNQQEYCPGFAPNGWVENNLDLDDSIYCQLNALDCAGDLCGNSIEDDCGICNGENNNKDCNGICFGTSVTASLCDDSDNDNLGDPNNIIDTCIELPSTNNLFLDSDGTVFYNSTEPIFGFQFDINGSTVINASSGDSEDAGFMISTNSSTVIGFSLTSTPIPAGTGVLIELELDGEFSLIRNIVASDSFGLPIDFTNTQLSNMGFTSDCSDEFPNCSYNYYDCSGECGGSSEQDECGVCNGNGPQTGYTCDGVPEMFTSNSSTLQSFYFFNTVTIDSILVDQSDWVGAFNGDVCVGAANWNTLECGNEICAVAVMGDDGSEFTNGYMFSGQIPTFKIFDVSENLYYDATPTENIEWQNLTFNTIESLSAIATIDYCISLHSGANLKSFYALPSEASIPSIMLELGNNINGVISEGGVCSQTSTGSWVGSQCSLSPEKGYWIIVNTASNLCLNNALILDPSLEYSLHPGANLISFPADGQIDVTNALSDDIEMAVSGIITEGGACSQISSGNWIGSQCTFSGSKGYWVITNESISFSFNLTELGRKKSDFERFSLLKEFEYIQSAKQAFYFVEKININGNYISNGWILAYNNNILVGARKWEGELIDIPVMGKDGNNYSSYYIQTGNTPQFKHYNDEKNIFTDINTDIIPEWQNNTINLLGELRNDNVLPESILLSAYPNPFNPLTNINIFLSNEGIIDLSIYNLTGQKVKTIYNGFQYSGEHIYSWNANNSPSGVYLVQLDNNKSIHTLKLVLLK